MDIEEIEEAYQKELENAERDFIKDTANSKDTKKASEDYSLKLRNAREKYYRAVSFYLEKSKGAVRKKGGKNKKEEQKQFKVEQGNFELSRWQKFKNWFGLWFFKKKFYTRNRLRENAPAFFLYQYYWWRLLFRKVFNYVKEFFSAFISNIILFFQHSYESFSEGVKKVLKYLGELPEKVAVKFKKKGVEKKEAGKEAEKNEGSKE